MGMILGYGLCSLFGLFYSAAHTIIPFILLGIGIDNIFMITQTFNTLGESIKLIVEISELSIRVLVHPGHSGGEVRPDHEARRRGGVGHHLHGRHRLLHRVQHSPPWPTELLYLRGCGNIRNIRPSNHSFRGLVFNRYQLTD